MVSCDLVAVLVLKSVHSLCAEVAGAMFGVEFRGLKSMSADTLSKDRLVGGMPRTEALVLFDSGDVIRLAVDQARWRRPDQVSRRSESDRAREGVREVVANR